MKETLKQAIEELKTVKSVKEWNNVRAKYLSLLSREEIARIDSEGLIVEVLGKDEQFINI